MLANSKVALFGYFQIPIYCLILYLEPLVLIPYWILGFGSIIYFKRNVPMNSLIFFNSYLKIERFYEDRKQFLNYYCPFIEATIGINTLYFLSYTISMINCYYWYKTNLTIFLTIGKLVILIINCLIFKKHFKTWKYCNSFNCSFLRSFHHWLILKASSLRPSIFYFVL